jgi:hypothetical protein
MQPLKAQRRGFGKRERAATSLSMSQSSLVWFIGCGGLLGACATSGVTFSGVIADPVVESADVVESSDAATELGVIEARCELPDDSLEDGLAYGDLVCSEALLRKSMRDTAAFVGGTHLSDVDCEHDDEAYECTGRVLRREPDPGSKPLVRKEVFDPWSIVVRLRPALDWSAPSGDLRQAEMVSHPAGHCHRGGTGADHQRTQGPVTFTTRTRPRT